jgi:hypothetical protein
VVDEEGRSESGSIFKIRPTPMTMQSTGGFRNPTGHNGVYKVDGHGRQSRVSGEENSIFLACHGAGVPAHPSIFFLRGLPRCDPRRLRQIAFWGYPQGYAAVVLTVRQKLHVVSRFSSMCYEGRFCYCTTRCMIGAVLLNSGSFVA